MFDELFPGKEVWLERWGGRGRCGRSSLDGFHLRRYLGELLSEEKLFVLDSHQALFERLVLLLDERLFAFKLLYFLSLTLSR